ncbi:MAG: imidazoleglycerol-phosphate dehydratase HisB [Anaerolineales bacterium]|nr:imidazoleglycerol-phosphate dehydratase HisB [Anaerolineales bacterium]
MKSTNAFLNPKRTAQIRRETRETQVSVDLLIDGRGVYDIHTGVGFLDHMLTQIAVHGLFDLSIQASGDLQVDCHHTVEDVALVLGEAFHQSLGDRKGIIRMSSISIPMDDSLAFVAIDLSGRPYCVFQGDWLGTTVGTIPVSLIGHFFESFASQAKCNLHAQILYGKDDHHKAEALFKGLGRALDSATQIDPRRAGAIPSSKGLV